MSAKSDFGSTKIPVEDNPDSGYLSGLASEQLIEDKTADSGEVSEQVSSEIPKKSDAITHSDDLGVCLLTDNLDDCNIDTPVAQPIPVITCPKSKPQDVPPSTFQQNEEGDTILHISAVHGCQQSIKILVDICPNKNWLNIRNDYGHTALHLAVMSKQAVVVKMLVRAGASIAVRDYTGETPLHTAVSVNHTDSIHALLNHPHDRQIKTSVVLNQKNYDGQTCVHLAANTGNKEILKTLVYYGADINAREGRAGWTPLHIAARRGDVEVVEYLLEKCKGVSKYVRDYAGRTAKRVAKRTQAFASFHSVESDSESDSEDDEYDSDGEELFEKLTSCMAPRPSLVA